MTSDQTMDRGDAGAGISRRHAMGGLIGAGIGAGALGSFTSGASGAILDDKEMGYDAESGKYMLPRLPYAYDALEPVIDEQTMRLHYGTHHQGYVNGLNTAIDKLAAIRDGRAGDQSIKHWSRQLAFHGCGHVNHAIFWRSMKPESKGGGGTPGDMLHKQIRRDFGTFEKFKAHFVAASSSVEGSGWGWLVWEPLAGRLLVIQMEKHQNLTVAGATPLLGVDVWEHAYYLKYQNRRSEYVANFMDIVDWDAVAKRYEAARG